MTYKPAFPKPGPSGQRKRARKKKQSWAEVKAEKIADEGPKCEHPGCNTWCFGEIDDPSIWQAVMGKDKFNWKLIEAHHIVSRSQGGTNTRGNMALLCPRHHRGKFGVHK